MSILSDAAHKHAIAPKPPLLSKAGKLITATASTGAALVSVVTFLLSHGMVGKPQMRPAIGSLNVAWVGLRPAADTATAVGDTLHFAATVTDKSGTILVGASPTWTTDDPKVATVLEDGTVIARGAGTTTVTLAVGDHLAKSRVVVAQRVASIQVGAAAGERDVVLPEAATRALKATAFDARGYAIARAEVQWRADDSSVVAIDAEGTVTGRMPGRAIVSATAGDVAGHAAVTVVAAPAAIAQLSGAAQRAAVGGQLEKPVVVRVTSRRDRPVEGVLVTFRSPEAEGGGRPEPASALTDADGRARTTWTLGDRPGRQMLLATVAQVDSALAVVAEADPVAANTKIVVPGEGLAGRAGERIAAPVAVRLTDSTGRMLPDVPVTFTALDGGTVDSADARTDSLGEARARWTLGKKAGTQRLRVLAGSGRGSRAVPPLTITASAWSGAAATLAIVRGDAQRATVGGPLPVPITVKAADAAGNPVPSVPLTLTTTTGRLLDTLVRTDSAGLARVGWLLGRTAGEHKLHVRAPGVAKALMVTATARPGAAANVELTEARRKSAAGPRKVVAVVTDEYGNVVADAKVRFTVTAGTVTPARAVTDEKGRVTVSWTPPKTKPASGEITLKGAVGGDARGTYALVEAAGAARQAGTPRAGAASRTTPKTAKPAARKPDGRRG